MTPVSTVEPDVNRLQDLLERFSAEDVGGTPGGGVSRPALSDYDKAARDRFRDSAEQLGLVVRVDDVGNMYARREGTDPSALPVVIGSHLDTVVPGGRFDGILGVAAALETVASMNQAGVTTVRAIEVVNWTGEEGARFAPAMVGSGVVTGTYEIDYVLSRTDATGTSLGAELTRIGYAGSADARLRGFFAALEMHIEQGTVLESSGVALGIVTVIKPVRWCTVTVTGPGGHAGGPGPVGRRDAMVAAARMVVAARDRSLAEASMKTTVGRISALPGSNNVIPHQVTFNLDVRSESDHEVDTHIAGLRPVFDAIARDEGVDVVLTVDWSMLSAPFSPHLRSILATAADARSVSHTDMPGTIGHDSLHLAQMGPAAMLFTPTRAGRSHCEDEFSPFDQILAATRVFADATLHLADAPDLGPMT